MSARRFFKKLGFSLVVGYGLKPCIGCVSVVSVKEVVAAFFAGALHALPFRPSLP